MIFLGIDYGTKRIGLAKANSEVSIAVPLKTILNNESVLDDIADIIKEENIDEIIVGLPVSFDGQEHAFAKEIRDFSQELAKQQDKKINLQNEILTSQQGRKEQVGDIDSTAAALILQSFLDRQPQLGGSASK